ncbi:MAG: hypothetical protein ABIS69_09315 [Sediminibacterium sp.]|uniref:hypothetical protein n=1 Tax=Flavobacterium sp. TaxID=239 RepID=UPI003263368B
MKEYQFEYTKIVDTISVGVLAIVTFMLSEIVGVYLKLNLLLTLIASFALAYLLFQAIKRKAVRSCMARLDEMSVEFEFAGEIKIINFNDLISFKDFNGRTGPVLYLKTKSEKFKIFAHNAFCKADDFKIFCDDTIRQLDKYKGSNNLALIHEGSIFNKK